MAKRAYIGIDSSARRIEKGHIGIDGIARKIKKAYIGIGSVARPFWSGRKLAYYGMLPSLSESKYQVATINVGNYGLVGCNRDGSYNVDAYDTSLTHTIVPQSGNKSHVYGTNAGAYGLIHNSSSGSSWSSEVNVYDDNLTQLSAKFLLGTARGNVGGASTGEYGLFAGGSSGSGTWTAHSAVTAFDAELTANSAPDLSSSKYYAEGRNFAGKAVFAGGYSDSTKINYLDMDVYDESLTKTSVLSLSSPKEAFHQVSVAGNYLLYSLINGSVDVYDTDFVKTNGPSLSTVRTMGAFANLDGFAFYAGGQSGSTMYNTVDVYDENLTRTTGTSINKARCRQSPLTVGNFALLCGGYAPAIDSNLEAFTLV